MPVTEITDLEQFNHVLLDDGEEKHGKKYIIVDFYATWCGPCKRFAPTYDELSETYNDKVVFLKVNIEDVEELVEEYSISSLPTFMIFDVGNLQSPYKSIIGAKKETIEERIKALGTKVKTSTDF